jgi:hypothetical protein
MIHAATNRRGASRPSELAERDQQRHARAHAPRRDWPAINQASPVEAEFLPAPLQGLRLVAS